MKLLTALFIGLCILASIHTAYGGGYDDCPEGKVRLGNKCITPEDLKQCQCLLEDLDKDGKNIDTSCENYSQRICLDCDFTIESRCQDQNIDGKEEEFAKNIVEAWNCAGHDGKSFCLRSNPKAPYLNSKLCPGVGRKAAPNYNILQKWILKWSDKKDATYTFSFAGGKRFNQGLVVWVDGIIQYNSRDYWCENGEDVDIIVFLPAGAHELIILGHNGDSVIKKNKSIFEFNNLNNNGLVAKCNICDNDDNSPAFVASDVNIDYNPLIDVDDNFKGSDVNGPSRLFPDNKPQNCKSDSYCKWCNDKYDFKWSRTVSECKIIAYKPGKSGNKSAFAFNSSFKDTEFYCNQFCTLNKCKGTKQLQYVPQYISEYIQVYKIKIAYIYGFIFDKYDCLEQRVYFADQEILEGCGDYNQYDFNSSCQELTFVIRHQDLERFGCVKYDLPDEFLWKCPIRLEILFNGITQLCFYSEMKIHLNKIYKDKLLVDVQKNWVIGDCCENDLNIETELHFCDAKHWFECKECVYVTDDKLCVERNEKFVVEHKICTASFQNFKLKQQGLLLGPMCPKVWEVCENPGATVYVLSSSIAADCLDLCVVSKLSDECDDACKVANARLLADTGASDLSAQVGDDYKVRGDIQIQVVDAKDVKEAIERHESEQKLLDKQQAKNVRQQKEIIREQRSTTYGIIGAIIGGVLLIIIVGYFLRRHLNQKKEAAGIAQQESQVRSRGQSQDFMMESNTIQVRE